MKVTLNNFQIFEGETEFEFPVGITTIVGPNASGKSSLFYAIENALTNPNGVDDCINFNHKQTEVTLENNDESITWIRNNSSTYINNKTNQKFVKASKLDSRDIADLGFYFNKNGKVLNIHNEWSVLFPFGESDTDMFRLFEDIFNISCSFQVIDEIKNDEQSLKSIISNNQITINSKEKELAILQDIKDKLNISEISKHIEVLKTKKQKVEELRKDYESLVYFNPYLNIVLPAVFDMNSLNLTELKFLELQKDYLEYQKLSKKIDLTIPKVSISLDMYEPIDFRNDYQTYLNNLKEINDLQSNLRFIQAQKEEVTNELNKLPICPVCGNIMENKNE